MNKSLEEIMKKYSSFGLSDYEIIKQFFIENHREDEAIKMLTELSQKRTQELNFKVSFIQEITAYVSSVLYNDIPFDAKLRLYQLCSTFTHRELESEELQMAQDIFEQYNITVCWIQFYRYLISKGCIKDSKELNDFEKQELERVKELLWKSYTI